MTDFKSTQAERRALAGSTATTTKDATTLHQLANLDTSLKGDFSTGGYVSGSERGVNYPAASGPWGAGPQVPPEPSLGFAIDAMEPTGEAFEVQRSLAEAACSDGVVCSAVVETSLGHPNPDQRKEDQ